MSSPDGTSRAKPLPTIPPYDEAKSVSVTDLTFSYDPKTLPPTLRNLSLTLPKGSRCLLLGANGSGKSTLLRLISGRHLAKPEGCISILGLNAFRDTRLNFHRSYLETGWGLQTVAFAGCGVPLMADIPVTQMMEKLAGKLTPDRRGRIALEVRETNLPAQLFFRSLGFRATTVLKDFYQDSTEDAYLMQYALEAMSDAPAQRRMAG